jgi:hypothetical protein
MTKIEKYVHFLDQNCYLLILGLLYGRPSYRRSLQPSEEKIQYYKKLNLLTFFYFVGNVFSPGSGPREPIESRSNPDPQHWQMK